MNLLANLIKTIAKRLKPIAEECATGEAELILQNVLYCNRAALYSSSNIVFTNDQWMHLNQIIERRLTSEPLPYILGVTYFHSKEFIVSPAVLIPRPDTETLVEKILEFEKKEVCVFADIGIGSGAIAETIASYKPNWKALGIDISPQALQIAKVNCGATISLVCGSMFEPLKISPYFDFIISNPPYISQEEMLSLDKSVKDYEPNTALFGGIDGLDFYRILAREGKQYCKPEGKIYCEIGYTQGDAVLNIFMTHGWKNIRQFSDLAGRARVVVACL